MTDTRVSMSLRIRLHSFAYTQNRSRKGLQFNQSYTKNFQLYMLLCRDGDEKYYSLFSVLHDRFLRDDFPENVVFLMWVISEFN